jgi:uracil-DNA glycosylase
MEVKIAPGWKKSLEKEFNQAYFVDLAQFLKNEKDSKQIFYPPGPLIFNAFNLTDINEVKVVILGQDPYHGIHQAHGLAFSVKKEVKIPPSLVNIYKELESDLQLSTPHHGFLEKWAKEGVLLLNNQLSVLEGAPMSHKDLGWDLFTKKIIEIINEHKKNVVFILWGSPAHKKAHFVDEQKHLVLKSVHPSPLSSYRGFFGSKPFSQTNHFLVGKKLKPIDWDLTK